MDIALKQRLVGASVLIALAVIVLPMLLGGRPEGEVAETRRIEIPAEPADLDFETRRYPIGETPQPNTAPPETRSANRPLPSPQRQEAATIEPAPVAASSAPVAEPEQPPAEAAQNQAQPVQPPPMPVSVSPGRYVVQVASFGSMANANRLSEVLGGFGYSVMLDSIKSDIGTLHRVRVGPYASESAATEAVNKIKTQVADIKPRVMDLQPEKAAEVSSVSDPLVRWVVQVGSFSNTTNADQLVERLRSDSLAAYKEAVSNSSGVIYRVRVGPFLERQEAIRIDQLIGEKYSLDGVVMSAN